MCSRRRDQLIALLWAVSLGIGVVQFERFIFKCLSPFSAIVISVAFLTSYLTALLGFIYMRSWLLLPARMAALISSIMLVTVLVGFYLFFGLYRQVLGVSLATVTYLCWFYLPRPPSSAPASPPWRAPGL